VYRSAVARFFPQLDATCCPGDTQPAFTHADSLDPANFEGFSYAMALNVVGVGLGRTGTNSLRIALEQLLDGPCYHMFEVFQNPGHAAIWLRAARGEAVDWDHWRRSIRCLRRGDTHDVAVVAARHDPSLPGAMVKRHMVTADGVLISASESENPDLFWGVRGAGGNFGIVTEFEFRLNPVGPIVLSGPLIWPMEQSANVLRFYRDWITDVPDELTTVVVHRRIPASPTPTGRCGSSTRAPTAASRPTSTPGRGARWRRARRSRSRVR